MRKNPAVLDIDRMPRGGPDASWVDRRLQTDRLEYLDRDDVDDRVKRQVVRSLERLAACSRTMRRVLLDATALVIRLLGPPTNNQQLDIT
jgi:hypothetical protein